MRLKDVKGFQVRNPQSQGSQFRLALFCAQQTQPVYISEPQPLTSEPLIKFNPPLTQLSKYASQAIFKVQIWELQFSWGVFTTLDLNLRSLDELRLPCEPNTLSILTTNNTELAVQPPPPPPKPKWFQPTNTISYVESISYPQLVDIHSLKTSKHDVTTKIDELNSHLSALLGKMTFKNLQISKTKLERQTNYIRKLITDLQTSNFNQTAKSEELVRKMTANVHKVKNISVPKPLIPENTDLSSEIRTEQARLASQLLSVFPIELTNHTEFEWSICGLTLPPIYEISSYDPPQIGAALSFIAQIVVLLSEYLDVALPYKIQITGSQTTITDDISLIKHGTHTFPLYTRGVPLYRFEYALYLLHKTIERLMSHLSLQTSDLKQTLANLKNVLLVMQ